MTRRTQIIISSADRRDVIQVGLGLSTGYENLQDLQAKRGCSPQGSVRVCAVNEANHWGCSYLHIRFLIKLLHQSINPRQQHVCCALIWQSGYVLATLFQLSMSFSFIPPLVSFPLHSVLSLSPVSSANSFTRFPSTILHFFKASPLFLSRQSGNADCMWSNMETEMRSSYRNKGLGGCKERMV